MKKKKNKRYEPGLQCCCCSGHINQQHSGQSSLAFSRWIRIKIFILSDSQSFFKLSEWLDTSQSVCRNQNTRISVCCTVFWSFICCLSVPVYQLCVGFVFNMSDFGEYQKERRVSGNKSITLLPPFKDLPQEHEDGWSESETKQAPGCSLFSKQDTFQNFHRRKPFTHQNESTNHLQHRVESNPPSSPLLE